MEGDLLGINTETNVIFDDSHAQLKNNSPDKMDWIENPTEEATYTSPAFDSGNMQATIAALPPVPQPELHTSTISPETSYQTNSPSNLHSNDTHSTAFFCTPYSYDQMITDAGVNSSNIFLKDSINSFLPSLTARYTLPDRTVASQVLMYRQLLHTACKPGLRLSRAFQGTLAQKSVMYMPWWEKNVAQTKRMVISYDNLTSRLWIYGAILPFVVDDNESVALSTAENVQTLSNQRQAAVAAAEEGSAQNETPVDKACEKRGIDCMMNKETGLPPIPHEYWVSRAGFQQQDPLTDFRSGGVLSLALLLHICESCPIVHARFIKPHGDASVLPFGITSINVTGMLARLCNFSKAVDKVDALMTAKPFWEGFRDPNYLLTLQEVSMELLADVVVELNRLKKWHLLEDNERSNLPSKMKDPRREVTVFDFPDIMETTEKRVRDDLLGAGPTTVEELRQLCQRLRQRYARACEKKERVLIKRAQGSAYKSEAHILGETTVAANAIDAMCFMGGAVKDVAGNAEGFFSRFGISRNNIKQATHSVSTFASKQITAGIDYQFAQPIVTEDEHREPQLMSL